MSGTGDLRDGRAVKVEPQDKQDADQGKEAQRDEKTAGKTTNSRGQVQGGRKREEA